MKATGFSLRRRLLAGAAIVAAAVAFILVAAPLPYLGLSFVFSGIALVIVLNIRVEVD